MIYRFDDFVLNPATRELHKGGEPVVLPARAFDCLAYLIEHRERAVGRDELIAAVWGRAEISEALLSHTVVKIRRGLGDTGNEQRTVRTVPRFGYRWGSATTVESVESDEGIAATPADDAPDANVGDASAVIDEPSPLAASSRPEIEPAGANTAEQPSTTIRRGRRVAVPLAMAAVVVAVAAATFLGASRRSPVAPPPLPVVEIASAAPAMVLPAEVDAPDDWRWLRFGLMDLIANRLRDGSVPTAPSESVVGLLKQRPATDGEALLHDAGLAQFAAVRVLPRVRKEMGVWKVRLDAFGAQHSFRVDAEAGDAIQAAREATDALLRRLGRAANATSAQPRSLALEELLQHSGAAMLADQLDQARDLITRAPPEMQQEPSVQQRMAQIELRAGDYPAVEARLHALLDRLPPERDDALRARAMMTLAVSHSRRGQSDRALELYEEAIALRQPANDHHVLGVARLGRGAMLAQRGRFDEATAELARARTELEAVGDGLAVAAVDVNLGEFQQLQHRPADALPILKSAVRQFERLGAREGRAYALAQQAGAETELLDADAALATSERFWPPESNTNNLRMRWSLAAARAAALYGVGRFDETQALLERIDRDADPNQDALARARSRLLAARLALQRGDAKLAVDRVDAALVPALRNEDPSAWTRGLLLQARAQRGSDRAADAARTTQSLQTWAANDDWRSIYAHLAAAEQAAAERRREPALGQFAEAMRTAEKMNVPEDLVAVGASYLDLLIEASQLDTARGVSGRIAMWAERDVRAAAAQARLFRALGQDDAARKAEENAARIRTARSAQL
ncbi:winged helix-turn-helix domain-containing protein [Dokdonella sp.]|uniref:winged helix-turn-helix domain-containing protein n=1 Tax=Dokdonella sp. TaxID=2291710 RepID=UPI001B0FB70E|nr:winged helix-turn-helix domain-containing protein [Dokdonella sp.]MBO9663033.1 winged helix-turn-helix domain-containing protein [Dokdonella sp.]